MASFAQGHDRVEVQLHQDRGIRGHMRALCQLSHNHYVTTPWARPCRASLNPPVSASIGIARFPVDAGELGLQVTAEGVETEAQHRFLSAAGCHFGQGFGYARPQPAEDFLRLLQMPEAPGWAKKTGTD